MSIGHFLGGIGALVYSSVDEKYLLLRRSAEKDFASGAWECVTGRVDQGEGFEEALRREVREELGVEIQIEFVIGTTHFFRGAELPENELIGIVCCVTLEHPGSIRVSSEHSEHRWVTLAEARDLLVDDRPTTRWILQILERAETMQAITPQELRKFFRQRGLELG